jgi:hypothetical protein
VQHVILVWRGEEVITRGRAQQGRVLRAVGLWVCACVEGGSNEWVYVRMYVYTCVLCACMYVRMHVCMYGINTKPRNNRKKITTQHKSSVTSCQLLHSTWKPAEQSIHVGQAIPRLGHTLGNEIKRHNSIAHTDVAAIVTGQVSE